MANSSSRFLVLSAGLLCITGSLAAASSPSSPPKSPPTSPLTGPRFQDIEPPGVGNTFDGKPRPQYFGREVPMPVYINLLKEALGAGAVETVRATPEQEAKVKKIIEDFGQERKAWDQANRAEADRLKKLIGAPEKGRPGSPGEKFTEKPGDKPTAKPAMEPEGMRPGEPDASDPSAAEREASRMRLEELRASAPKPTDAQTKIWDLLSEPQRKAMTERIEAWKADEQRKANEKYVKERQAEREKAEREKAQREQSEGRKTESDKNSREPGDQGPAKASPEPRPAPKPSTSANSPDAAGKGPGGPNRFGGKLNPEMRERFVRLLEQLGPDERDEVLRRLEQRLEQRLRESGPSKPARPGAPAPSSGAPSDNSKPIPSLDKLKLPTPPTPPAPPTPPPGDATGEGASGPNPTEASKPK